MSAAEQNCTAGDDLDNSLLFLEFEPLQHLAKNGFSGETIGGRNNILQ